MISRFFTAPYAIRISYFENKLLPVVITERCWESSR